MSWALSIIEVYILAVLVFFHASLLLCTTENCSFDAAPLRALLPEWVILLVNKLLSIVPLQLSTIQTIAQLMLLGDLFLLLGVFLNMFGAAIKFILWTVLLSLGLSYLVFWFNNGGAQTTQPYLLMGQKMWDSFRKGTDL